jgi:hypothetical protein
VNRCSVKLWNTIILGVAILSAALGGGLGRTESTQGISRWVRLDPIEAETPIPIGQQKQLLVDEEMLCDWWNVRRVQAQVKKHPSNPMLKPDQPWEIDPLNTPGLYPYSIIYDPEDALYKLWYRAGEFVGFATSKDGLKWIKPKLGLIEHKGTKDNNLCRLEPFGKPIPGRLHLIPDTRSRSAERKFQAIGIFPYHEDGTYYTGWSGIAFSKDGTTWHMAEGGLREGAGGGEPSCVWDERLRRYVLFHRQLLENALSSRYRNTQGRYVVRQESADLVNWSPRRTAVKPMGTRWPEVEAMIVFRHEGIYFGLAHMLDSEVRGEIEIHLLTSRDGYHWQHPFPDEAFIPRGTRGEFDEMMTYLGHLVLRGDEMRFYYAGSRYPHSKPAAPIVDDGGYMKYSPHTPEGKGRYEVRASQLALATTPLDRFIGLRMDEPVGGFLTRPILVEGDELYVNGNVDRELRVEVVNPTGRQIDIGQSRPHGHYISCTEEVFPGFSLQDCEAIAGDSLRHKVHWKGGSLGRFKGQGVRLRFAARMAEIYAFQIQ